MVIPMSAIGEFISPKHGEGCPLFVRIIGAQRFVSGIDRGLEAFRRIVKFPGYAGDDLFIQYITGDRHTYKKARKDIIDIFHCLTSICEKLNLKINACSEGKQPRTGRISGYIAS